MQETRRAGRTEFTASGFQVFTCGTETGGTHEVGIAVEEALCTASKYSTEYVDEHLMAMKFEMAGHRGAVNFVAAYAPTDVADADTKSMFWDKPDSLVRNIPARETVFVLMDANAQTRERIEGEDMGTMGEYGHNELNDNGRLLLTFAADNKLAVLNTFDYRKGGIWHTYNGPSGDDRKCLDYILTRQPHRRRVSAMTVVPQPVRTVTPDSDQYMVVATVDLGGRLARNRPVRTSPKKPQLNFQDMQADTARWAVSQRFVRNLHARSGETPTTAPEMAKAFTEALLDAAGAELSEEPPRRLALEWNTATEAREALAAAFDKRIDDDEPTVLEHFHAIITNVWNGGEMPQEWKDTAIKMYYKKGDRSNCNSFKGISLLSRTSAKPGEDDDHYRGGTPGVRVGRIREEEGDPGDEGEGATITAAATAAAAAAATDHRSGGAEDRLDTYVAVGIVEYMDLSMEL
eukprot:g16599.t1